MCFADEGFRSNLFVVASLLPTNADSCTHHLSLATTSLRLLFDCSLYCPSYLSHTPYPRRLYFSESITSLFNFIDPSSCLIIIPHRSAIPTKIRYIITFSPTNQTLCVGEVVMIVQGYLHNGISVFLSIIDTCVLPVVTGLHRPMAVCHSFPMRLSWHRGKEKEKLV